MHFRETQLDKKILSALLKGDDKEQLYNQLFLAMIWDRVDLAEEKILVKGEPSSASSLLIAYRSNRYAIHNAGSWLNLNFPTSRPI